jgi:hypothetical protein
LLATQPADRGVLQGAAEVRRVHPILFLNDNSARIGLSVLVDRLLIHLAWSVDLNGFSTLIALVLDLAPPYLVFASGQKSFGVGIKRVIHDGVGRLTTPLPDDHADQLTRMASRAWLGQLGRQVSPSSARYGSS